MIDEIDVCILYLQACFERTSHWVVSRSRGIGSSTRSTTYTSPQNEMEHYMQVKMGTLVTVIPYSLSPRCGNDEEGSKLLCVSSS